MTRILALASFVLVVGTSCGRYSQPIPPATKEEMEENPRVYGKVDGPAEQSLNKYETDPDAATQAAVLKAQLFGRAKDTAIAVAKVDTAAALRSSAE
jgi:hypothetical protein